jgi:CBS domain-containing protein
MSATVVSCRVDEDLAVAARRMAEHSVRRLPVVDGEGRIRGVVSLNDLARAAHKDEAVAREAMTVLTAVCRPRATLAKTATSATHSSGVVSRHGKQALPNPQRARVLMSSKVEPEC